MCPRPNHLPGCPVHIDIPGFTQKLIYKDFRGACDIIADANLLLAIRGRVCPQENQCEGVCPLDETLQPVAIGRLEHRVGDLAIREGWSNAPWTQASGLRAAIVGSGPASIACAADPDAGTCRELVEAAESCQVAIIHPGNRAMPTGPASTNCGRAPGLSCKPRARLGIRPRHRSRH